MDSLYSFFLFWFTGRILEMERLIKEQEKADEEYAKRALAPYAGLLHGIPDDPKPRPKLRVVK